MVYEKGNEGFTTIAIIVSGLLAGIFKILGGNSNNKENNKEWEEFKKKFTPIAQKYLTKAFQYRDQLRKNYKNLCQKEYQNLLKCSYAKEILETDFTIFDEKDLEDEILFSSDKDFSEKVIDIFLRSISEMKNKNKFYPVRVDCGRVGAVGYNYDYDNENSWNKFLNDIDKIKYAGNIYVVASPIDDQVEFEAYIDLGITPNDIKKIIIDAKDIKEDKGNESLCSDYIYLLDL